MQLSKTDLLLLTDNAIAAAFQAGEVISQYMQQSVEVHSKIAGDSHASQVVTEVDIKCQQIIETILLADCKIFDLAFLTEESVDDKKRLEKDYFWCVDPLDGTLPFIEKSSGYAVSIALVSQSGIPVIGVIYDPLEQTLYHAIYGEGAFRNGKKWKYKNVIAPNKHHLTIVSDRSFIQQDYYHSIILALGTIADKLDYIGLKLIHHGGAAMNACWVLENSPAVYFKFPKQQDGGGSLWDYAASACLFNEIGAVVSDIHGQTLNLNRAQSSFMNHAGIIYSCSQDLSQEISQIYNNYLQAQAI
ncbi:MAG: inositol monophosphatase family protein [Pseudomonadota bacterium]